MPHCRDSFTIQSNIVETKAKLTPLAHIYIATHFPNWYRHLKKDRGNESNNNSKVFC